MRHLWHTAIVSEPQYERVKAIVREQIEIHSLIQASEIFVYPDYPYGWHAVFGAFDPELGKYETNVLFCIGGALHWELHKPSGFFPNGAPIVECYHTKPLFELLKMYVS